MKLLIKQATIVDPNSPFNGQLADIFIENGMITHKLEMHYPYVDVNGNDLKTGLVPTMQEIVENAVSKFVLPVAGSISASAISPLIFLTAEIILLL